MAVGDPLDLRERQVSKPCEDVLLAQEPVPDEDRAQPQGSDVEEQDGDDSASEASGDIQPEAPKPQLDLRLCISTVQHSEEAVTYVAGRDVVMVIGNTGVGKTSFILSKAGCEFLQLLLSTGETVYSPQGAPAGFEVNHLWRSVTKHLTHLDSGAQGPEVLPLAVPPPVYVDSPGKSDSQGDAIDVATAVSWERVAQVCRGLRFVVLISWRSIHVSNCRIRCIREVLKQAGDLIEGLSTGKKFKECQRFFTFVFTHPPTVAQSAEEEASQRKSLEQLLEEVKSCTSGLEQELLKWMIKCLKENLRFVQIFHPSRPFDFKASCECFKTDAKGRPLAMGIEGAPPAREIVRCAVSQQCEGSVELQLGRLREALRLHLHMGDSRESTASLDFFRQVAKYLQKVECVPKALKDAEADVLQRVHSTKTVIFQMLQECLNLSLDSDPSVKSILGKITFIMDLSSILNCVTATVAVEEAKDGVRRCIQDLVRQHVAAVESCSSRTPEWQKLGRSWRRLQDWREAAPDHPWCEAFFDERTLEALQAAERFAALRLASEYKDEALEACVQHVAELWELYVGLATLETFGCAAGLVQEAKARYEPFSQMVQEQLGLFCEHCRSLPLDGVAHLEAYAKDYSSLSSLGLALDSLVEVPGFGCRAEALQVAKGEMQDTVQAASESMLQRVSNDLQSHGASFATFRDLLKALELLDKELPSHLQVELSCGSTAQRAAETLKGKLEGSLQGILGSLPSEGLAAAAPHKTELLWLRWATELDRFLPEEERWAEDLYRRLQEGCRHECGQTLRRARELLERLSVTEGGVLALPDELRKCFGMVPLLEDVLEVFPSQEDELRALLNACSGPAEDWCQLWRTKSEEGLLLNSHSDDVEGALQAAAILGNVPYFSDAAAEVSERLQGCLQHYRDSCNQVCQDQEKWEQKAALLKQLQEFESKNLQLVMAQLPTFQGVLDVVKATVGHHLERLQALASASRDGKDLLEAVAALRPAAALDPFLDGPVERTLASLQELALQLQHEVDEVPRRALQSSDYSEVLRLLSPENPRGEKLIQVLRESFSLKASSAHRNIADGQRVAAAFHVLQQALRQLSSVLPETAENELSHTLMDLLAAATKHLEDCLASVELHLQVESRRQEGAHLRLLYERLREVESYHGFIHDLLTEAEAESFKGRIQRCAATLAQWLEEVLDLVRAWLLNFRHPAAERNAVAGASQVWQKVEWLRRYVAVADVEACFKTAQDLIAAGLGELHSDIREGELSSSALEVYEHIDRELNKGLRSYLPEDVQRDLSQALERLRQEEKEVSVEGILNFPWTKKQKAVLHLKKRLDASATWAASAASTFGLSWLSPLEYQWRQRQLCDLITTAQNQISRSLRSSLQGEELGSQLLLLHHARETVGDHMPAELKSSIERLEAEVTSHFNVLATRFQGRLLEPTMVPEYFDIFRFVAPVLPSLLPVTELAHQHLLAAVQKMLEDFVGLQNNFDFRGLAELLPRLRRAGSFLTGPFQLYVEELKEIQNVERPSLQTLQDLVEQHFGGLASKVGPALAVLGLPHQATAAEVASAVKRLSKLHSPEQQQSRKVLRAQPEAFERRIAASKELLLTDSSTLQNSVPDYANQVASLFKRPTEDYIEGLRQRMEDLLESGNYNKANKLLASLAHLPRLGQLVQCLSEREVRAQLEQEIANTALKAQAELTQHLRDRNFQAVQAQCAVLRELKAKFTTAVPNDWQAEYERVVKEQITSHVDRALELLRARDGIELLALELLRLARIMKHLNDNFYTSEVRHKVNVLLDKVSGLGWRHVIELGLILEGGKVGDDEDKNLGKFLVQEFVHFKEVRTVMWNAETGPLKLAVATLLAGVGMSEITPNGPGAPVSKTDKKPNLERLKQALEEFDRVFDEGFLLWRSKERTVEQFAQELINMVRTLPPCSAESWPQELVEKLPHLLAIVSLCYTIKLSGDSYLNAGEHGCRDLQRPALANESSEGDSTSVDKKDLLIKPHAVQIVACLLLLGFADERTDPAASCALRNQLAQIRTGEGKSIVLGLCATILGLLGFRVRCVCYSEYLSTRDRLLFEPIFRLLRVNAMVRYSTVMQYAAEKCSVIWGKLRDLVNNTLAASPARHAAAEFLLVDEVDVLFGPDFMGHSFNPVADVNLPEGATLLQETWRLHKQGLSGQTLQEKVMATQAFRDLKQKMVGLEEILKYEVEAMCSDVALFQDIQYKYCPIKGRFGVKELDGYNFLSIHGYKTAFACLQEAERGELGVSPEAIRHYVKVTIDGGNFSYAKLLPQCILGVSGTLEALAAADWVLLKEYNISTVSWLPSVYGKSNFSFGTPYLTISTKSEHYRDVADDIRKVLELDRPVIVFLKDEQELEKFKESSSFISLRRKAATLTELTDHEARDFVIRQAAGLKQLTLCTAPFGRGTDFMCYDQRVEEKGGVYCLQTFVSLEESEEVQIRGRTARQGRRGTYSLIVEEEALTSSLGLSKVQLEGTGDAKRACIREAREKKSAERFALTQLKLAVAGHRHELSQALLQALNDGDRGTALAKLHQLYNIGADSFIAALIQSWRT